VAAGGEYASESVVGEVAEAAGDSAGGFDDAVDRFRGAVGSTEGAEVGPDRCRPLFECAAQS
jgi:hypothetical protein